MDLKNTDACAYSLKFYCSRSEIGLRHRKMHFTTIVLIKAKEFSMVALWTTAKVGENFSAIKPSSQVFLLN